MHETVTVLGVPPELVAPIVTGIFTVITVLLSIFLARRNARMGNRENRAPDVQEMWAQQEADRRTRQVMEDMWWDLRGAFKSYFRRVSSAILMMNLTKEQLKIFTLTKAEHDAINAVPPEDPGPTEAGK
jgi:hypothetical protein